MEHKEFRDINVIPFVDIMLVLLTIVLTTATFIVAGEIAVNLPEAKHRDNASMNPVVITLTKNNELFIDKDEIPETNLTEHLRLFNNGRHVVIRADEEVAVRRFAYVIDAVKSEGFKKVSMEVKAK
jgi:biopolymer transport protein ExbD